MEEHDATGIERVKRYGTWRSRLPFHEVKQMLDEFQKTQPDRGFVVQNSIYSKNRHLYYQLSLHNPDGKMLPGPAIEAMGYRTYRVPGHVDEDYIREQLRRVLPLERVRRIYSGEVEGRIELINELKSTPEGKRAYRALFNNSRSDRQTHSNKGTRALERLVNTLYEGTEIGPSAGEKAPLFLLIRPSHNLSTEDITEYLRRWLYAGEDLVSGKMEEIKPMGAVVQHAVDNWPLKKIHYPLLGEVAHSRHSLREKLMFYINIPGLDQDDLATDCGDRLSADDERIFDDGLPDEHITVINLNSTKIVRRNHRQNSLKTAAVKILSLANERRFAFPFFVMQKYDPYMKSQPKWLKEIFVPPLEQVYAVGQGDVLRVRNGTAVQRADARIQTGGLDCLVEVKSLKSVDEDTIDGIIGKYARRRKWLDGESINRKVIFLNNNASEVTDYAKEIRKHRMFVITAEQFSEVYARSIELLMREDPDFCETASVPLTDPAQFHEIGLLLSSKKHLLLRRWNRKERNWINEFFKQNIKYLQEGHAPHTRHKYKPRHIDRFSNFTEEYGEDIRSPVGGAIFLDYETSGFRNTGSPIFVSGLAYMDDDGEMITDQILVRNPLEERDAMLKTIDVFRKVQGRANGLLKVYTFNGTSFDIPYCRERMLANLVPFDVEYEHTDLFWKYFNRFAKMHQYDDATLQTFERTEFGFRRDHNISGSEIPLVADNLFMGKDTNGDVMRVLAHNRYDLLTLKMLASHYEKEKENQLSF